MKRSLTLIAIILVQHLLYGQKEGFVIEGKINGLKTDREVHFTCDRNSIDVRVPIQDDGTFRLSGKIEGDPAEAMIQLKKKGDWKPENYITFYLENATYHLEANLSDLHVSELTGSAVNDIHNELQRRIRPHRSKIDSLHDVPSDQLTKEQYEENSRIRDEAYAAIEKEQREFVEEFTDTWQALDLLNSYADRNLRVEEHEDGSAISNKQLKEYYQRLSPELKQSKEGVGLYTSLYVNLKGIKKGEKYIEFDETFIIDGGHFMVADIKTDYYLVEFTSTWCGGCIKFKKAMTPVYDQIKDKVEVVSFYTDNNKDKIIAEKDEIDWMMVSDFKGYDSPMVKHYKVQPIPDFFFFNKEGILIRHQLGYSPELIDYMIGLSSSSE